MKIRSTVLLGGKTATGIPVTAEVVEALGGGKRPAVTVTIGTYTYRSTVGQMDGQFMIPLSAAHRAGAGVAAGDDVDVEIELDTAPRDVDIPSDFAEALDADPALRSAFEALSNSNKKRIVLPIEDAKTPETRQRRVEKAIAGLRDGTA